MAVKTGEINLLVFDLEGTIFPATRPTSEAIKRAYAKLGLAVEFTEKDIEKYFGVSSDEFYQAIAPKRTSLSWQDIRLKVRAEYSAALNDHANTYPEVKDTLKTLKKRDYKLALFSNSGINWFYTAVSALNIKGYFDYIECIVDHHLTKIEMIRMIKEKFDNPSIAVIGDRIYDLEAARATGSLAIGAEYGYGGKEPEAADLTVSEFAGLLNIFDRKLAIFEKITQEIQKRKSKPRAFTVGITGIDLSGKTELTTSLAAYLTSKNYKVMVIHLDDFHNPRAYRNSGTDPVENYWQRNFDLGSIIRDLLVPIRQKAESSIDLTLLNLHTDKYELERQFSFDRETIVLFEGVFLFRKELAPYLDYKVFIEIPFEEGQRRAVNRDIPIFGEEIMQRYETKYWPAQMKYLAEYPPLQIADMIIDNKNWEYPVTKFVR